MKRSTLFWAGTGADLDRLGAVNIYLIPYTWARHVMVSLNVAAAALLAWWITLVFIVALGPIAHGMFGFYWSQSTEGLGFLALLSGTIGGASVFIEGSLRRRARQWRFAYAALAFVLSFVLTAGCYLLVRNLTPYLAPESYQDVIEDPSLVSFRFTLPIWALSGVMSGLGPWFARKLHRVVARTTGFGADTTGAPAATSWSDRFLSMFLHTAGGMTAGVFAGGCWQAFGQYDQLGGNLYVAGAAAAFFWGLFHGALVWGIPAELYAGWVRILSAERYGLRIPVDRNDGRATERFIGHFPRGLDMYMPAETGVTELHTSFVVDADHNYAVRGLSVQPTIVKRLFDRVNLAYDPNRPAPLETQLQTEDRVLLGIGTTYSEVEFILLPKEEL